MLQKCLLSLAVVLSLATITHADAMINVGDYTVLPNQQHVAIQIFASSTGDVTQGMDLNAEILDGTTFVGGVGQGPESVVGPRIGPATTSNPDIITRTIFASNNTGANVVFGGDPHLVGLSVTTASGAVPTNGLIATIFLDTTGVPIGAYTLSLNAPDFIPTDFAGSPGVGNIIINDGIVIVEPEPSSIVLGLLAATSFGLIAERKRRARVLLTLAK